MKTIGKSKIDFEGKPQYYNNSYFSDMKSSHEVPENQQFVVPWQMVETKEKKKLVK
ncbi:MAG: hypothetical protein HQ522_17110 [Bacteroidetes bacterium]|nr:hypothetical protein [Bacteroidota bacterium]